MINLTVKTNSMFELSSGAWKIVEHPANSARELQLTLDNELIDFEGASVATLEIRPIEFHQGEIWILFNNTRSALRFYRPSSNSNTILVTEQCDQNCIMCSQPPKNKDYLYFDLYSKAVELIDHEAIIGISGGEPSLFKALLFNFLISCSISSPKIKFHVLTNGQHFSEDDLPSLKLLSETVLWAIPIYSDSPTQHDEIVGKAGAFKTLINNLSFFALSSSDVEIRTVVLQQNIYHLPRLALFLCKCLPWISHWSIMQLEKYGYARLDWENKFYDTSTDFQLIGTALDICRSTEQIKPSLLNFPICTVPEAYRDLAKRSISDWKQKYEPECSECVQKSFCCGFFEWYDPKCGFKRIGYL